MIITSVLSTFVLYLCTGVSKLLPFFVAVALAVFALACVSVLLTPFSELIRSTQKRE
jgi:hypothetical protein